MDAWTSWLDCLRIQLSICCINLRSFEHSELDRTIHFHLETISFSVKGLGELAEEDTQFKELYIGHLLQKPSCRSVTYFFKYS